MNSELMLSTCLHGGEIKIYDLQRINKMSPTVEKFLSRCIDEYGACGFLAIDEDKESIVGFIRFYPEEIYDQVSSSLCVHQNNFVDENNKDELVNKIIPRQALSGQLKVQCIQVVTGYFSNNYDFGNQGIGKLLYQHLIEWATQNNWQNVITNGVNTVPPLLKWSGYYPKDSLIELGFNVETTTISDALKETIQNQIEGHHGPEVKESWDNYKEVNLDDISSVYTLKKSLKSME